MMSHHQTPIGRPKPSETEKELLELQKQFMEAKKNDECKEKMNKTGPSPIVLEHKNLRESSDSPPLSPTSAAMIKHKNLSESFDEKERGVAAGPSISYIKHKNLQESSDSPWTHSVGLEIDGRESNKVLSGIHEKNIGLKSFEFVHRQTHLSRDSGFPEPESLEETTNDRIDVGNCNYDNLNDEIDRENKRKLAAMSEQEIMEQQQKLIEKMDPTTVSFLRSRYHQRRTGTYDASHSPHTHKQKTDSRAMKDSEERKIEEAIRNLEIMDPPSTRPDWLSEPDSSMRIAADPISMDLASKCSNTMKTGREMAVTRLFDSTTKECRGGTVHRKFVIEEIRKSSLPPSLDALMPSDELLEIACDNIDHIKSIYLDREKSGLYLFKGLISPSTDPLWMFVPLTSLYKTVSVPGNNGAYIDDKDINLVVYVLMWLYVLARKRGSYLNACVSADQIYWHLSIVFNLGPQVYLDILVYNYLAALLHDCILPQIDNVTFSAETKVIGIESLLELYKQMLTEFEDSSYGEFLFTNFTLLPAFYGDLTFRLTFWSDERTSLLRCTTITSHKCWLPEKLKEPYSSDIIEDDPRIILAYAHALASGAVTHTNNPLLFAIAEGNLRKFLPTIDAGRHPKLFVSLKKVIDSL